MEFDPIVLSRLQFGLTASFHIIFPCLVIGLAFYLAILEYMWLRTKRPIYCVQYKYWLKPFVAVFFLGMITGVVLSFQLDTTFSGFYERTASVLVPIRQIELANVLLFEAGTLGIMLCGWRRVGPKLHFTATLMMVIGVLISAICITARNAWMQTPDGFVIAEGQILVQDWMSVIVSPSFPYRLSHMLAAAFLSTAFFVLGISAWYLLRNRYQEFAQRSLKFSLLVIIVMTPVQIFLGHLHGVNTHENQPTKIAAMEGLWETQHGAPMVVFGIPDQDHEVNRFSVEIPKLASLVVTHDPNGKLQGLNETPKHERPNVAIVFISFRIMILLCLLMLLVGMVGIYLLKMNRLFQSRKFLYVCVIMLPSGLIATIAGWIVSEVGRQPWVISGLIKTSDVVTATPSHELVEFIGFISIFYLLLFFIFIYSIKRFIGQGPIRDPSTALSAFY